MKRTKIPALLLSLLLSSQVFAGDKEKERELRQAAIIDDIEAMEQLLDEGVAVDAANIKGKTALMMAVENGNMDTIVLLL
ncbi:ankyrin, partial [Candidatus Endoriftia persephone str. Guaymas]|nr:ankyrin [Candidatus Endoriftia persephone str. Guaymas]